MANEDADIIRKQVATITESIESKLDWKKITPHTAWHSERSFRSDDFDSLKRVLVHLKNGLLDDAACLLAGRVIVVELTGVELKIKDFAAEANKHSDNAAHAANKRKEVIEQIAKALHHIVPFLHFLYQNSIDVCTAKIPEFQRIIQESHETLEKAKEELKGVPVSKYNGQFTASAKAKRKHANGWLIASGAIIVLALGYAVWQFGWNTHVGSATTGDSSRDVAKASDGKDLPGEQKPKADEPGVALVIQRTIGRLVILSLAGIALSVCLRSYRANLHLAIIDEHRANSLATFEAFIHAQGADDDTKQQVIRETTKTIFATPTTGLVEQKDEGGGMQIVEIIKAIGARGQGG